MSGVSCSQSTPVSENNGVKMHGVVSPIQICHLVYRKVVIYPLFYNIIYLLIVLSANRVLRNSQLLVFANDLKTFLRINLINDYYVLLHNDLTG